MKMKLCRLLVIVIWVITLTMAATHSGAQVAKDLDQSGEGASSQPWLVVAGPVNEVTEENEHDRQMRLIPLRTIDFEVIREIVEPAISPAGQIHFIAARNAVLVQGSPAIIRYVEEVLEKLDQPAVNIRVAISFDEASTEDAAGIGLSHGGLVITRERGGRIEVEGGGSITGTAGTRHRSSATTQFLVTGNNHPARIWVGESVARPVWTFEYGIRRGWWQRELVYQHLGASLWIHPRLIGDRQISIEVYPMITVRGETPLSVKARELSTQVIVTDGQTIQLGGLDEEKREAYRGLFGIGRVFNGQRLAISLKAEIMHP